MEKLGWMDWRAEATLHHERHELRKSGPTDRGDEDTEEATISVVTLGAPPKSWQLDIGHDDKLYSLRNVTGGFQGKHWKHELDDTDDRSSSGKPLPQYTDIAFHIEPGAHKWRITVDTAFDRDEVGSMSCYRNGGKTQCPLKSHQDNGQHVTFQADQSTPTIHLTQVGDKYMIDGTLTKNDDETHMGEHLTVNESWTVHIVIQPDKAPQYEAVLVPKNVAEYHAWIPKGPKIPGGNEDVGANTLKVILELRDAKTHRPALTVRYTPHYKLEPSKTPGWCMNYPAKGSANTKPDLFFEAAKNPRPVHTIKDADHTVLDGIKLIDKDEVVVSSRDYGAFGHLAATAELEDGTIIVAKGEVGSAVDDAGLAIPEDTNLNNIADQWERDTGIFGAGYPSTWDEEADPPGMATKGDGYGLYDEYRGFYVSDRDATVALQRKADSAVPSVAETFKAPAPKYQRLDPNKRDLLAITETDGVARGLLVAGALRYATVTGINVRFVPQRAQLDKLPEDDAAYPRWANFDSLPDQAPFGKKQAAVWIIAVAEGGGEKKPPAQTEATSGPQPTSPLTTRYVHVFTANCQNMLAQHIDSARNAESRETFTSPGHEHDGWARVMFYEYLQQHPEMRLTSDSIVAYATAHAEQLVAEVIEFTVIHELGHATGAEHHVATSKDKSNQTISWGGGDPSCPMRYWHYNDKESLVLWITGNWNPAITAPHGAGWKFCTQDDADWTQMRLRQ
jgi:hypothetical protein